MIGFDELLELPARKMVDLLQIEQGFNDENLESLAELMHDTAELNDLKSDSILSNHLNQRALEILEHLNDYSETFSVTRGNHIRKIKVRMKNS